MKEKEEEKELDLISALRKIVDAVILMIKKAVFFLGHLLQLTYRYKYILLFLLVLVLVFSIYRTTGNRKIYQGEIVLKINDGDSFLYSEIVSSLNQYLNDKDPAGLADEMKLPLEKTKKIGFFHSYYMIDLNSDGTIDMIDYRKKYALSDSINTRVKDRIVISVGIKDIAFFPELKNILLDYFKNNQYLIMQNENRLGALRENAAFYEKNIQEIDSLQHIEYFEKKTNYSEVKIDANGLLQKNTEKQMFYKDKMNILREKEKVNKELASESEIIKVIMESKPSSKQINSLPKTAIKYSVTVYVLFLFFCLLWEWRKEISSYLKNT